MESILQTLIATLIVLIFLIIVCVIIYILISKKDKMLGASNNKTEVATSNKEESTTISKVNIKEFLDFDEVKDNMIIRKGRTQYVMVIQCQGVNYDLLSEEEQISVEEGFVQFLNTLRFPIQLYVQTQSLNFEDIISEYKNKIHTIENEIRTLQRNLKQAEAENNTREIEMLNFELRRKNNVLEYGADITNYVSRLSLNKNVLKQKTYIIVSYYTSEFNGSNKFDKEEADNIFFSELYTRTKTLVRAISTAGVVGRILDSEELSELLYVAYNRDDSNMLSFNRVLESQYDALYSTGKDVLKKKEEMLDEKIEEEAVNLVTESIIEADKKIQEEDKKMEEAIIKRAMELTEEYKHKMTDKLYDKTVAQVKKRGRKPNTNDKISKAGNQ